jgi:hypothetical protein
MTISEGAISIQLPQSCVGLRFDGVDHGMSHCMKAVDFIIDTPRSRIYLEIKDPDAAARPDTASKYTRRLVNAQLDKDLYYKYRDSWIYLHATNDNPKKPHYYFILLGLSTFSTESLAGRSLALQRKVSIEGPNGPWASPFVDQVFVFNIETWNRNFPEMLATRI